MGRMTSFPDEVLEHVLAFLSSHRDRNSVSLVCKSWCRVEAWSRQRVFIGNCYAASPEILIKRFPRIKSVTLKGKPHFADFNFIPAGWGADVHPWIAAMAKAYPWLEELRLKRMVVTDESLELLAHSFPNFKVLVLTTCEGFSTDGLATIAAHCRELPVQRVGFWVVGTTMPFSLVSASDVIWSEGFFVLFLLFGREGDRGWLVRSSVSFSRDKLPNLKPELTASALLLAGSPNPLS
eukprot:Gb_30742 [translate_table: standard]